MSAAERAAAEIGVLDQAIDDLFATARALRSVYGLDHTVTEIESVARRVRNYRDGRLGAQYDKGRKA